MNRGIKAAAIFAVILGIAAAVLLGVFRIQSIDIRGNERYGAEQIRDDLIYDFKTRNTLYFSWIYRTKAPAEDAPYLASVQATMLSPTSIRLDVTENQLVGRVQYGDNNVYYDNTGAVQEISETIHEGIPLVTGIEIEEPQLYQKLAMDNASTLRTMLNITQLLIQSDLIPDSVSFDSSSNMTLRLGSVTVKLGQDEYLEEKIANLVTIYPQIAGQDGTLNMEGFTGKNEAITFKTNEPVPEPAQDESEAEGSGSLAGEGSGTGEAYEEGAEGTGDGQEDASSQESVSGTPFMVFDSSGTLRYDAHVVNGQVVDGYGNLIDGCRVDENGNVVDAYWNVIDPNTGQLAQ